MLWRRGKTYSQDLRERVFAEADDGEAVGEIAALLRVSMSYVSKVLSRRRLTGETTARPQRCQLQPKLAPLYDAIHAQVQEHPDATISELQRWLQQTHHVSACFEYRGKRAEETPGQYGERLVVELEAKIQALGPETVIAFMVEPGS